MQRRNILKLVHFINTALLVFSAGYILVLALRQGGKSWWFVVSLSSYSAPIAFLLISLYLFAIHRGVSRNQRLQIEHPLTTSVYYMLFYDTSPFLGILVGVFGAVCSIEMAQCLLVIATGCLWATFLVWIIVDPAVGLIEMLLPSSQKHRWQRLAQSKFMREKERLAKLALLAEIQTEQQNKEATWRQILKPKAEKLAALMTDSNTSDANRLVEVVDLGLNAWQIGGLSCMRLLHLMTMEIYKIKWQQPIAVDYIAIWWNGIGSWRSRWFEGETEFLTVQK